MAKTKVKIKVKIKVKMRRRDKYVRGHAKAQHAEHAKAEQTLEVRVEEEEKSVFNP